MYCERRILFAVSDAEYDCQKMRLAIYIFAHKLQWPTRKFLPRLLEELGRAKVHFKDHHGRIFDLDVSCFEDSTSDGDDPKSVRQYEALRCWFGEHFCREQPYTLTTMPKLSEKGEERFKVTASILIAAYGELEDELIRLANEGPV